MTPDAADDTAPVRFGLIGVGVIGRLHAQRLLSGAAPATLVALADHEPAHARLVAQEYGVQAADGVAELLGRNDLDAVIIAVPSGLHAQIAVAALEAGKHVLLEKPIEVTASEADRILHAQERSGRVLSVVSQHRFAGAVRWLKAAIDDGVLGRVTSATIDIPWWRSQGYYDSASWRGTWALDGGGALMNQGVHLVDLALWLLGPAEDVFAHTGVLAHEGIEVEDTLTATARLRSGALLAVRATTAAYGDMPLRLAVSGDAASIVLEDDEVVDFRSRDGVALPDLPVVDPQLEQLQDVIGAIRTGTDPLVTGLEAREAVAFIEAAYRSARTGSPVRPAAQRSR